MKTLPLVRDVLDAQVLDRDGHPMGKVDGIVLQLDDGPPKVTYLEIGIGEAWRRVGVRTRWEPFRVPWSWVLEHGTDIRVGVDAEDAPPLAFERWLRRKLT